MATKTRFCCFLLIFAVFAVPSFGAGYTIFGAAWDPSDADVATGFGIRYSFDIKESWALELTATQYFEAEETEIFGEFNQIHAVPLDLGIRYHLGEDDKFRPSIGLAASFIRLRSDLGELDDEWGASLSLGARLGNGKGIDWYGEVLYRYVNEGEIKRADLVPQALFPVELGGVGVNLGITWSW